jgi:hypothetical protein
MRKWLGLAVLALPAFLCAPTRAELATGEKAPNFEGKEIINSSKCDLKSLRGHVILYEVFRTW